MEVWKDIKWFEWLYQISNQGRVKSLVFKEEKILKTTINKWYRCINLTVKKITFSQKIHRLIWIAFIDNPKWKPCINHKDWDKLNNNIENLEWCTHSENNLHKFRVLWYKKISPHKWKFWKDNHLSKKVWLFINNILEQQFYWIREAVRDSNFCEASIHKSLKKWVLVKWKQWKYL